MADIRTDERGFVYVDGVKICQRVVSLGNGDGPVLRFYDKCKRRSSRRGSCFVDVSAAELVKAVRENG